MWRNIGVARGGLGQLCPWCLLMTCYLLRWKEPLKIRASAQRMENCNMLLETLPNASWLKVNLLDQEFLRCIGSTRGQWDGQKIHICGQIFYKRKSDQYLAMIFNLRFPIFLKIRIGANMETSRFPWPNQATYLTGRGENKRYDCSALGLNKYLRIMKIIIKPLLLIYCWLDVFT